MTDMMKIKYGRVSVCMGDDVNNGEYTIEMPEDATFRELMVTLLHGGNGCDWPIPYTGADSFWIVNSNVGKLADIYTDKDGEWHIEGDHIDDDAPLWMLGVEWIYCER